MSRIVWKALFWAILAIPGLAMIWQFSHNDMLAMDMLHPSGEMSIRLMILAMLAGPLSEFFGLNRFFRAWLAIRRNLGVAAFGYAILHLAFYFLDMPDVAAVLDELGIAGIWTGWLALALMIPPASISFDKAMRRLGRKWKMIQRLVYAALIISLVHWLLLDWDWWPAFIHLAPLMIAWGLRWSSARRKASLLRSI
ncbi:ferric reductase-like transmembrane domain-containing protein [Parasphingorhabdus flavimaris]|uniref:ferric reductase-like transmembrane domain-containing protein n=1 Tax=Parasphingorhabdus flavimaris TaxID=266812 RepID=UPI003003594D|tara:strand:+ start:9410 stop:9997 length:588 start_codon:yes stop_codon:yes gene_type:complete